MRKPPLKLKAAAPDSAPGATGLPDGSPANRVRHHAALLAEAVASLIGEASNADSHSITAALEGFNAAFEGTSFAIDAAPQAPAA